MIKIRIDVSLVSSDTTAPCDGFTCVSDGVCLPAEKQCNKRKDCVDNSDEQDCTLECAENQFKCFNNRTCLHVAWKCDGDNDCSDGSDEMNCRKFLKSISFLIYGIFYGIVLSQRMVITCLTSSRLHSSNLSTAVTLSF